MKVLGIFILCVITTRTNADLCSYKFSLSKIPNPLVDEVISLLTGKIVDKLTDCYHVEFSTSEVKFWLSTRNNPNGVEVNSQTATQLNGKPTIILIHGWTCTKDNAFMPELKDAYLKQYDVNVIRIDWSKYSIDYYANSYCNVPRIAVTVASFLCSAKSSIDIEKLHIVGHSMGAQMAGLIGQEVKIGCNKKIGRISGLDPAGPYYQLAPISERLDDSDAVMVDVIHTNLGVFGYLFTCGTLDFFPNLGVVQPGCIRNAIGLNLVEAPLSIIACSHLRSVDFMLESIHSDKFKAKFCLISGLLCIPNILSPPTAIMGEHVSAKRLYASYYLTTSDTSPYALG